MWETAYDVTDTTFDCNVNRTNGDTGTQMYLINHFLDRLVAGVPAPDSSRANTTNAVSGEGSLGVQVQTCAAQYGRNPNFMLVDVSRNAFLPRDSLADAYHSSMSTGTARCSRLQPMPTE